MKAMRYVLVLIVALVALTAVSAASHDQRECVQDAKEHKIKMQREHNSDYRYDRMHCYQDFADCKVDYWVCLMDLHWYPPVFAKECQSYRDDCYDIRGACLDEAEDLYRSRTLDTRDHYWDQRRDCKYH